MLKYLERLVVVDVPNDYQAICTNREEVGRAGILRTPVYLKDVRLMKVVPLLVGFGAEEGYHLTRDTEEFR